MDGETYVSDKMLARRYNVARQTPWNWARKGTFPQPVRLAENTVRWRLSDIEAHEASLPTATEAA